MIVIAKPEHGSTLKFLTKTFLSKWGQHFDQKLFDNQTLALTTFKVQLYAIILKSFLNWYIFIMIFHSFQQSKFVIHFWEQILESLTKHSVLNFVGCMPSWVSCHCAFVSFNWVQNIFLWYFVGPKFFLMDISWVQRFFLLAFHGSKIFPHGYFVGPKFYDFQ